VNGDPPEYGFLLRDNPGRYASDDEVLYPDVLADMLRGLRAAGLDSAYVEMAQCYSGSFIEPLSGVVDGTATGTTATGECGNGARVQPDSDGPKLVVSQFELTFLSALAGAWPYDGRVDVLPPNTPDPSTADADGDGNVSWREAYNYSADVANASDGLDDPQYGDGCPLPPEGEARDSDPDEEACVPPDGETDRRFLTAPLSDPVAVTIAGPRGTETVAAEVEPLGGSPRATVDPGTLPGSVLYPVDRFREGIDRLLAVGPDARTALHIRQADERVAEATALAQAGRGDRAGPALVGYADAVDAARATVERAEADADGAIDASVRWRVVAATADQTASLSALQDGGQGVPPREVTRAIEAAETTTAWGLRDVRRLSPSTHALVAHRLETAGVVDDRLPDGWVDLRVATADGVAVAGVELRDGRVIGVAAAPATDPVATVSTTEPTLRGVVSAADPAAAFRTGVADGRIDVSVERPLSALGG
jgi:hypothetical protein